MRGGKGGGVCLQRPLLAFGANASPAHRRPRLTLTLARTQRGHVERSRVRNQISGPPRLSCQTPVWTLVLCTEDRTSCPVLTCERLCPQVLLGDISAQYFVYFYLFEPVLKPHFKRRLQLPVSSCGISSHHVSFCATSCPRGQKCPALTVWGS